MENLKKLENKIRRLGWFQHTLELRISLKSEFEGFYGKALEDWEQQVTIEVISPDESVIKNVKVVGGRTSTIDDVAKEVLKILKN